MDKYLTNAQDERHQIIRFLLKKGHDAAAEDLVLSVCDGVDPKDETLLDEVIDHFLASETCKDLFRAYHLLSANPSMEACQRVLAKLVKLGVCPCAEEAAAQFLLRALTEEEVKTIVMYHANSGVSSKRDDDELLALGKRYHLEPWAQEQLAERDKRYAMF